MSNITLRMIESMEDFAEYEKQWETFCERLDISNMCLSFSWLFLWCRYYLSPLDRLIIHCYFEDNEIIGIFPVYLKKISCGYQLRFVATGEKQEAGICSEFQDFMLEPEKQEDLLTLFTKNIFKVPKIISYAFDNILSNSVVESWLNHFNHNWVTKNINVGVRYIVKVENDQTSQISTLKSKTTKRHAKQYITSPDCFCERLTADGNMDDFFNELIKLHNHSWHERGQKGVFENEQFRVFHYEFATQAHQKNKLVMFKVLCKNKTVAIFYGVIDSHILSYYQSGILRQSTLPAAGVAMHVEALVFAQENELEKYDLMKGKPDSYKQRIVKGGQLVFNTSAFKKQYSWLPYFWKLKSIVFKN